MVNIVNGYVCFNCTDVANAKRGINPAHPKNDPLRPAEQNALAAAKAKDSPAVILSGTLNSSGATNTNETTSTSNTTTQNAQPAPAYSTTGTQLDISA